MKEHTDVSTGKADVGGFGNTGSPCRDDQLPAVMRCMVIYAGKDALKERCLALGIRTGDSKDLPLPYTKAGHRPVARQQLQFGRIKFRRAAEGDAYTFLGTGNAEERTVPGKCAGKM
jgi:hypothetical protein